MSKPADLDAEELKFLAIQASGQKLADQALLYLKQAILRAPQRGDLYYLMAAEHAQLGMYDRAAEEMEHAIQLSPELHTARLQLGMLHLGAARVEAAQLALRPLQELAPEHPLHQFGAGLLHLMHDQFSECRAALETGIALNVENPALNGDMKKIIDALPAADAGQAAPPASGNVWLSAYRKDEGAS
jgi:tetratricopeptide (TPR) repeat protein